jgi:three-Cys-motif partner protein
MTSHKFGGDWTEEKLERVRKYLSAYTIIFARNPRARMLTPIYVDAFAGTGYRTLSYPAAEADVPLPELLEHDNQTFLKGSARIALEVDPPFKQYIFIERDAQRAHELESLRAEFPQHSSKIQIITADANTYLMQWCAQTDWRLKRAVIFLDPYGMQVEWPLIEAIGRTKAIDLWILFPLGVAVNRLLTKSGPPPKAWAQALTRLFGSDEWSNAFYPSQKVLTLFGEEDLQTKRADYEKISVFFVERLKTVFTAVAENPLPLLNSRNNPLYLLCFASGNPVGSRTAIKIAQDILKR